MSQQSNELISRLNKIAEKLRSPGLLSGHGIANEIAFHVFDYPPEFELEVRKHISTMLDRFAKDSKAPKTLGINLFSLVVEYLKHRDCLEEALRLENEEGTEELAKSFEDLLSLESICEFLLESYKPKEFDLMLLFGVGSCFPFLRGHSVLNNLQNYVGNLPVVLFYPGSYSGTDLSPFGLPELKSNYYRAFRLID